MTLKTRNQPNATPRIVAAFRAHPARVGETYLEHAGFAFRFSGALFLAGAAALVHAIFPFLCETTASRTIRRLAARVDARH